MSDDTSSESPDVEPAESVNSNTPGAQSEKKVFWKRSRVQAPSALFAQSVGTDEPASIEEKLKVEGTQTQRGLVRRKRSNLQRNKKLAYVIAFTHYVGFLTPIWVIFGTDHLQLSLTLAVILGSTSWVASALFEIPMGAFADRYGRQLSVVLGLALCAIGDIALVLWSNFYLLMAFQILAGLGFAMRSGSLEGLLHDTYEANGETTEYAKVSSHMLFLLNFSRVFTIPIGAWLYELNTDADLSSYTWPYIASVASYCIALGCASFLYEERSEKMETPPEQGKLASVLLGQVGETIKEVRSNSVIVRVIVLLALYALIGEANWALYQSYFREHDIDLSLSMWIYVVLTLCMAFGSRFVSIVYKRINVMWSLIFIIAIVSFNIVLMQLPLFFACIGFVINAFVGPMCLYLHDNAIQNRMSGNHKSTALSLASMAYTLGAAIGVYGVASIADSVGISEAQWLLVGYGVLVVGLTSFWCYKDGFDVLPEDRAATLDGGGDEQPFDEVPQLKP